LPSLRISSFSPSLPLSDVPLREEREEQIEPRDTVARAFLKAAKEMFDRSASVQAVLEMDFPHSLVVVALLPLPVVLAIDLFRERLIQFTEDPGLKNPLNDSHDEGKGFLVEIRNTCRDESDFEERLRKVPQLSPACQAVKEEEVLVIVLDIFLIPTARKGRLSPVHSRTVEEGHLGQLVPNRLPVGGLIASVKIISFHIDDHRIRPDCNTLGMLLKKLILKGETLRHRNVVPIHTGDVLPLAILRPTLSAGESCSPEDQPDP
jgi:hypothetical protein